MLTGIFQRFQLFSADSAIQKTGRRQKPFGLEKFASHSVFSLDIAGLPSPVPGLFSRETDSPLFILGYYNEAIKVVQRAIELDPKLALSYQNSGYLWTDLQRYQKAIAAFQGAIDLDPQNARPRYGLGLVYYILKDYEAAITIFQEAIRLDPTTIQTLDLSRLMLQFDYVLFAEGIALL